MVQVEWGGGIFSRRASTLPVADGRSILNAAGENGYPLVVLSYLHHAELVQTDDILGKSVVTNRRSLLRQSFHISSSKKLNWDGNLS